MTTVDASHIVVGSPDQAVTGAILSAQTTAAAPTKASDNLTGFSSSGYVDENGVNISQSWSTTEVVDWSGAVVRKILESFTGDITFTSLEFGEEELKQSYGDEYVTVTTDDGGTDMKVSIGKHLPPVKSWAIRVKDGDTRVLVYVPRGQITAVGNLELKKGQPIKLQNTVSCYDDGTGNSIYIFVGNKVYSA